MQKIEGKQSAHFKITDILCQLPGIRSIFGGGCFILFLKSKFNHVLVLIVLVYQKNLADYIFLLNFDTMNQALHIFFRSYLQGD